MSHRNFNHSREHAFNVAHFDSSITMDSPNMKLSTTVTTASSATTVRHSSVMPIC